MKRNFLFIFLILCSLVVFSCASKKTPEPVILEKTKEITKTVRDTTYIIEADSSFYTAYIDCVNGKPVIRENSETKAKSKPGQALQVPKPKIEGNVLTVDCYANEHELKKQWEETYIKEHEQTPIEKPVEVEKPLTFWLKTQIWFGRIFMGILSLSVIIGVLRWKRLI